MKLEGQVTIENVAAKAGVSRSTVGRVIGNYGSVSEKSRKKVLEAIEELNYSPNAIAQSLRIKKTNTIAVVVDSVANKFFSKVIGAIEIEAFAKGYNVFVSSTHEKIENEISQLQNLQSRQVDAIILSSLQSEVREEDKHLYKESVPIVYIDHEIRGIKHSLIESDNYKGTFTATEYLIKLGHRKIGVLSTSNFPVVKDRLKGYKDALKKHDIQYDEQLILDITYHRDNAGQNMIKELLMMDNKITAVLILNNNLFDGALLGLRELNKKIPDDISLITWDDTSLNDLLGITAIAQFPEMIGKVEATRAIKCIEERREGKQSEKCLVRTLDTELRIRTSCRNINEV